ncbi:hypothetical protein FRB99_001037 [Tulasnella sp. 403]|nr:hypothetical protein FRB99_001037 [Tulasnella sp. 403]
MSQWNPQQPSGPQDDWGNPQPVSRPPATKAPVPDDWDAEEEVNESKPAAGEVDENKLLWEQANSRAPPPQVVLASNSGSTQIPQLLANAPRTILKRPTAAGSGPAQTSASSAATQKSLQEREASYQAARERIFGSASPAPEGDSATNIIRTPRGPPDLASGDGANTTPKAGFAGRVARRGHGRTISDLEGIPTRDPKTIPPSDQTHE